MKFNIAIAYHKNWEMYEDKEFIPIHVGKTLSDLDLGIVGDNIGDNISILNPYFCEMTAMYSIWKNYDADYKGLCHYRRLFSCQKEPLMNIILNRMLMVGVRLWSMFHRGTHFTYVHSLFLEKQNSNKAVSKSIKVLCKKIEDENIDIVCTKKTKLANDTVRTHFCRIIGSNAINLLDSLMKENSLLPYYQKIMDGSEYSFGNMFIMKKQYFNEYCNIIFPILFSHYEKSCGSNNNIPAYYRITGYIAEILTATYLLSKEDYCRVLHVPTFFIDNKPNQRSLLSSSLIRLGFFHTQLLNCR